MKYIAYSNNQCDIESISNTY